MGLRAVGNVVTVIAGLAMAGCASSHRSISSIFPPEPVRAITNFSDSPEIITDRVKDYIIKQYEQGDLSDICVNGVYINGVLIVDDVSALDGCSSLNNSGLVKFVLGEDCEDNEERYLGMEERGDVLSIEIHTIHNGEFAYDYITRDPEERLVRNLGLLMT